MERPLEGCGKAEPAESSVEPVLFFKGTKGSALFLNALSLLCIAGI